MFMTSLETIDLNVGKHVLFNKQSSAKTQTSMRSFRYHFGEACIYMLTNIIRGWGGQWFSCSLVECSTSGRVVPYSSLTRGIGKSTAPTILTRRK